MGRYTSAAAGPEPTAALSALDVCFIGALAPRTALKIARWHQMRRVLGRCASVSPELRSRLAALELAGCRPWRLFCCFLPSAAFRLWPVQHRCRAVAVPTVKCGTLGRANVQAVEASALIVSAPQFDCGSYGTAAELLDYYKALCTNSEKSTSATWGKLAACILLQGACSCLLLPFG